MCHTLNRKRCIFRTTNPITENIWQDQNKKKTAIFRMKCERSKGKMEEKKERLIKKISAHLYHLGNFLVETNRQIKMWLTKMRNNNEFLMWNGTLIFYFVNQIVVFFLLFFGLAKLKSIAQHFSGLISFFIFSIINSYCLAMKCLVFGSCAHYVHNWKNYGSKEIFPSFLIVFFFISIHFKSFGYFCTNYTLPCVI